METLSIGPLTSQSRHSGSCEETGLVIAKEAAERHLGTRPEPSRV